MFFEIFGFNNKKIAYSHFKSQWKSDQRFVPESSGQRIPEISNLCKKIKKNKKK